MRGHFLFFTIVLSLCITLKSCVVDIDDHKLKLVNNSDFNFYYVLKKDSFLIIEDVSYIDEISRFNSLKKGDTCHPLFARKNEGGYVSKINNECADSTLYIYLFKIDSVKKYGWINIINMNEHIYRQGFKVRDLNNVKWLIDVKDFLVMF